MKRCNKPVPKAKNGKSRGTCRLFAGHFGKHSSKTCRQCGTILNIRSATSSIIALGCGLCRTCVRKLRNSKSLNKQILGNKHIFPCGCKGLLPKNPRQSNKFAIGRRIYNRFVFGCRVYTIISSSQLSSKYRGYSPIPKNTSHLEIRKLMERPNCERCSQPLSWAELGRCKTPHLHHDHETGEIYGFTHPVCNPLAMKQEIEQLRKEIKTLRRVYEG